VRALQITTVEEYSKISCNVRIALKRTIIIKECNNIQKFFKEDLSNKVYLCDGGGNGVFINDELEVVTDFDIGDSRIVVIDKDTAICKEIMQMQALANV